MLRRTSSLRRLAALVVRLCACAALALLALPALATAGVTGPTVSVQVASSTYGRPLQPGFVGLSIEYKALADYLGRNPAAINPVFVALLRNLTPGGYPILRIGGDSTDETWWPVPGTVPTSGLSYALSKRWLGVVHSLAVQTDAHLILGINLAVARPQLAATESRALISGIGRPWISALEIGNEPDLYDTFPWYQSRTGIGGVHSRRPKYGPTNYASDATRWAAALPRFPLAGPALADLGWLSAIGTLTRIPELQIFTTHRYPLLACQTDPSAPSYASIPNLLADSSSAGLAATVAPYVPTVHADGMLYRVDELNSAACEGKLGVSNSFASALWILDTLFNMAAVGVDGVNVHTLPGAAYAPFSFTDSGGDWTAQVNPIYYGMLMFTQAFPAGARLLNVQAPGGPLKAWATVDAAGRIRVVLINQDQANSDTVNLTLPTTTWQPLSEEALSDPDGLPATSGVTLGGQSFGSSTSTGNLAAPQTTPVEPTLTGGYTLTVPASSAVLLTNG